MEKTELLASLKKQGFSEKIINAFAAVDRKNFIPPLIKFLAYDDNALPIGHGQTISQPHTIAVMLDLLHLKKDQKVLEVGCGSGYVLALMSEIVSENGKVYGLEIIRDLVERSKKPLYKYQNVQALYGDGRFGMHEKAPFDRILISAALTTIPEYLVNQLNNDGIIVAPIGNESMQSLVAYKKSEDGLSIIEQVPGFAFVHFV
ncbi:MAG: protein-L-isoaspartate O-methyltransferase [Nanoarchaeota archaeon]